MTLGVSGSKHHNNWHLLQHTPILVKSLLTTGIPGQLPRASFLSLKLVISYGKWNRTPSVPHHDCQQMDTITAYKANISVKLIHLLPFTTRRSQLI